MQSLDLNLASRPFRNNTLLWAGLLIAVVVLGLLSVWNYRTFSKRSFYVEKLKGDQDSFENKYAELDREEAKIDAQLKQHELAELVVRADKANDVIHWKAFSWTRLFNQLQEVLPYDVQMTSVRPVFREDRRRRARATQSEPDNAVPVNVEGVAKTIEAFLDFERRLFEDPHFDRVEPEGYEVDEHSRETIFRLRFQYRPDGIPAPEPVPEPEVEAPGDEQAVPVGGDVETVAANDVNEEAR